MPATTKPRHKGIRFLFTIVRKLLYQNIQQAIHNYTIDQFQADCTMTGNAWQAVATILINAGAITARQFVADCPCRDANTQIGCTHVPTDKTLYLHLTLLTNIHHQNKSLTTSEFLRLETNLFSFNLSIRLQILDTLLYTKVIANKEPAELSRGHT